MLVYGDIEWVRIGYSAGAELDRCKDICRLRYYDGLKGGG